MKYQRTDKVQSADFSCLEELKCDIIENLLSMIEKDDSDEVFEFISIIISKNKVSELFNKLKESEVNGFNFEIDYSIDNINQEVCLIYVATDGKIGIEEVFPNTCIEADFFYIDANISSLWFRKVDDGCNEILIFDIEDED